MIVRYTGFKGEDSVTVVDDSSSWKFRKYQENIKDVLLAENEMKSLSTLIEKKQNELQELQKDELVINSKKAILKKIMSEELSLISFMIFVITLLINTVLAIPLQVDPDIISIFTSFVPFSFTSALYGLTSKMRSKK